MNKNGFIFYVLHKSHGKRQIRNFFNWTFGNDFQTLQEPIPFPEESFYPVRTLATKQE
nr:hypothetical protein [uncultured Blautia sp.]